MGGWVGQHLILIIRLVISAQSDIPEGLALTQKWLHNTSQYLSTTKKFTDVAMELGFKHWEKKGSRNSSPCLFVTQPPLVELLWCHFRGRSRFFFIVFMFRNGARAFWGPGLVPLFYVEPKQLHPPKWHHFSKWLPFGSLREPFWIHSCSQCTFEALRGTSGVLKSWTIIFLCCVKFNIIRLSS